MQTNTVFERGSEWGGYSIHPARTGWIVSQWSLVQGTINGRVTLHAYTERFPRGADLDRRWNDYVVTGEALRETAPVTRVIRRGHRVF